MRAYPAAAVLNEMRSLRPGSDVTDRLDNALATKLVGALRFRRHHFMAGRMHSPLAAAAFLAHSNAEQAQADAIAGRMVQLGAEPSFSPTLFLKRSHAPFMELGTTIPDMAQEGLDATRMAMTALLALARSVGAADARTRQMLVDIVAADQVRTKELAALATSAKAA